MIATGPGIVCPNCGADHCEVTDSRGGDSYIRRRRTCRTCVPRVRFTTVELVVDGTEAENHRHQAEPVLRAMQLQARLERMPMTRRQRVLALIDDLATLTEKET